MTLAATYRNITTYKLIQNIFFSEIAIGMFNN